MEVPEEVLYRARLGHVHMDIVLYRVQRVKPRATVKSMVISMELLLVTKLMVTSTEVPEEVLYRARVGHVHTDTVLYRVQLWSRATVKSMVISMELLLVTKLMVTSTEVPLRRRVPWYRRTTYSLRKVGTGGVTGCETSNAMFGAASAVDSSWTPTVSFETSGTLVPSNDVLSEKRRHGWCYGF